MRRFLSVLSIALLFFIVSSAPALADIVYTFKGYGYGHGIGLCQWGAKGRALKGQSYRDILSHYYQGTQVTNYPNIPSTIKVRLFGSSNLSKAYVEGYGSSPLSFIKTDGTYAIQGAVGKWSIAASSANTLKVIKPDGTVAADDLPAPIFITNDAGKNIIVYNASGSRYHAYTGSIYVYPASSNTVYLVNRVNFEPDYINGLAEMPSSWPYDALYAQAVAARSYALANMKPQATFDLYDSVASQVYIGVDKINETSNGTNWGARWAKAVADTKGQVITYNGQVISAYYFSSCGGHTENIELAWPKSSPQPYLKGVDDIDSSGVPYCKDANNTNFSWVFEITRGNLESKLGITGIASIKIAKAGVSGRASELQITKLDGTSVSMTGQDFRSKLGLKSTWLYQMGGTYPDVDMGFWAFPQIEELTRRYIVAGYPDGTFKPQNQVSRAEFSKMLCLSQGFPAGSSNNFTDVGTHWAAPYISALSSRSIIKGYPDGTFRPDAKISRAEMCSIITRAIGLTRGSASFSFSDIASHWAKDDIEIAASNGIVSGYDDGTFRPEAKGTRAEVSAMIYRMLAFMQ